MTAPLVCIAILAHNKEHALPIFLHCIESLDYPKDRLALYIRTNNNNDQTKTILDSWVNTLRMRETTVADDRYHSVFYDATDIDGAPRDHARNEWTGERFKVLGAIRQASVTHAQRIGADFYFVVDSDNFLLPNTLKDLVAVNLPVVAPFLRVGMSNRIYSNYHAAITEHGYYKDIPLYYWIFNKEVKGLMELPVVHCTYLIRRDAFSHVCYDDDSNRYEYVIFSDCMRKAGVPQYIDNRQTYGVLTFDDDKPMDKEAWLQELYRYQI